MDSSGEADDIVLPVQAGADTALQGYQFEPRRETNSELDSLSDDSDQEPDALINVNVRLTQPVQDWCTCGFCDSSTLQQNRECICCH